MPIKDLEKQPTSDAAETDINKAAHYNQSPSGVECIVIAEHMSFCLGNVLKYIWRAGLKGPTLKDLKKARYYLNREIDRLEKQSDGG